MKKQIISESKLTDIINESIYEVLQEAQYDEGLGHWLGNAFQTIKNKWDNFKGDFNAGRNKAWYDNRDYDSHSYYGDEANNFRNFGEEQYKAYRDNQNRQKSRNSVQHPRYSSNYEDWFERLNNRAGTAPQGAAPQGAAPQGATPQGAAPQGAAPQGGAAPKFGQGNNNTERQKLTNLETLKQKRKELSKQLNDMGLKFDKNKNTWRSLQNGGRFLSNNAQKLIAQWNAVNTQFQNHKIMENKITRMVLKEIKTILNETSNRNMGKAIINERRLNQIISESIKKVIRENAENEFLDGLKHMGNRMFNKDKTKEYADKWSAIYNYYSKIFRSQQSQLNDFQRQNLQRALDNIGGFSKKCINGNLINPDTNGNIKILSKYLGNLPSEILGQSKTNSAQQPSYQSNSMQPQMNKQQTVGAQQPQQGGGEQQEGGEDVKSLMKGAQEYAKEVKMWQKGMGGNGEMAMEQLKSHCKRISSVTGQDPKQLYKDILAGVYV